MECHQYQEWLQLVPLSSQQFIAPVTHIYLASHAYLFGVFGLRSASSEEEYNIRFALSIMIKASHSITARGTS
jgi:hypothetical protein